MNRRLNVEDMMTTETIKHTPGPWQHVEYGDGEQVIEGVGGVGVAVVSEYTESTEANARLIAAAPDLLAALEAFINDVDDFGPNRQPQADTIEMARAAAARARGE